MIRWETAASGSSDQQCHSQNWSYPIWTPLLSAPASQAPDRLHSCLLAYFSQVYCVRLYIILPWRHFPTIPKTQCLLRSIPLPCGVSAMRKGPSLYTLLCGKGGGSRWGVNFNEFTEVLQGLNWSIRGMSLFYLSGERRNSSMCPHSVPTRPWELAMGSLCPQGTGYYTCEGKPSFMATLGEFSSASPSSSFSS